MADSKKLSFSIPPILNIFLQKLHGLVLGLVGHINTKDAFLACFRAYVGQPDNYIG